MKQRPKTPSAIIALCVAVFVVGGFLFHRGFSIATGAYVPGTSSVMGKIISHHVALDERQWNGNKSNPIAVESVIATNAGNSVSRRFFKTGENAWDFALKHQVGAQVDIHTLGNGDELSSNTGALMEGFVTTICGGLLVILSMALLSKGEAFPKRFGHLAFFSAFLFGGMATASLLWPAAIRSICASWWEPVPIQIVDERKVASGKHGRVSQFAIRYSYLNVKYETANEKRTFAFRETKPAECRINPAAPWQVTHTWGFTPALLTQISFPLTFILIGFAGISGIMFPSGGIGRLSERVLAVALVSGLAGTFIGFIGEIVWSLFAK